MRFCRDIAMFTIDRGVDTCTHATEYCEKHCYNRKPYRMYGNKIIPADAISNREWLSYDLPCNVRDKLRRARRDTSRIRLMSRGEGLATLFDITRVAALCGEINSLVWLPTRAWRSFPMAQLDALRADCPNLRMLLSIDCSTLESDAEMAKLHPFLESGYSTMFFGDNTRNAFTIAGREYKFKKCPKTWEKKQGHCIKCRGGCFSPSQVHIHLKKH